jgi:hemolysin III
MSQQVATAPIAFTQRIKDPFSGLSHAAGFVAAATGSVFLALLPRHDSGMTATLLIYALTLMMLYAASATYHLVRGSERLALWLRRMDHCAIFLFIAGSCTPLFYQAFDGTRRTLMLLLIWVIAVLGVAGRVLWLSAPRWLYTAMYVAMGWAVLIQGSAFVGGLEADVFYLVVAGGLTYTAGAVIYALKRPNFFGGRVGFHEIWHLFVIAGSAFHYAAVYLVARG